ncbi:MAG: PASTA domain-containing protein, partial [Acidimicrobiales bacterium]
HVVSWSYKGKASPSSAPYGASVSVTVSKGMRPVTIPSITGESWTRADATLAADGLAVKEVTAYSTSVPKGDVVSTTPRVGTTWPVGTTVSVTVSQGSQYVVVPTVVGDTVPVATSGERAKGLSVAAVYGPATGVVFTSDPLAGQRVKIGTAVALYSEATPASGQTPGATTPGTGPAGAATSGAPTPPTGSQATQPASG